MTQPLRVRHVIIIAHDLRRRPTPTVEVRIAPADVATRMDEMQRWLNARRIKPGKFISTGSADEAVVLVEFGSGTDAEDFAKEFWGSLVDS
jgi:hypothetical protein